MPLVGEELKDLINLFQTKIKGKRPEKSITGHDGSIGHWIERQFNLKANNYSEADWHGYELKTGSSKTTFGDWTALRYLWHRPLESGINSRNHFIRIFGSKSRSDRPNRYSWSGKSFPKVGQINSSGQTMEIDDKGNISAIYFYSKDQRFTKDNIVPEPCKEDNVELAFWKVEDTVDNKTGKVQKKGLRNLVNDKFNQKGWVKFVANKQNVFTEMWIGGPFNFNDWIINVKKGIIYLDSGMYYDPDKPNNRPYSNWRASNSFWKTIAKDIVR